jgi:hypothetical protein
MITDKLIAACQEGDTRSLMQLLFSEHDLTQTELIKLVNIADTYQHLLLKKILQCYTRTGQISDAGQSDIACAMVFYLITKNKDLVNYPHLVKHLSVKYVEGFIELAASLGQREAVALLLSHAAPRHLPHVRTATYWASQCRSEDAVKQVSPTAFHYAVALEQLGKDRCTKGFDFLKALSSDEALKLYQEEGEQQAEIQGLNKKQMQKYEALSTRNLNRIIHCPMKTEDTPVVMSKIFEDCNWVAMYFCALFGNKKGINFNSIPAQLIEFLIVIGIADLREILVNSPASLELPFLKIPGITYSLLIHGLKNTGLVTQAERIFYKTLFSNYAAIVAEQFQQAFKSIHKITLDLSISSEPYAAIRLNNNIALSSYAQWVVSITRFGIPVTTDSVQYDFKANNFCWDLVISYCNTAEQRALWQASRFIQAKLTRFIPNNAWLAVNKESLAFWKLFGSKPLILIDLHQHIEQFQEQLKVVGNKLAKLEKSKLRSQWYHDHAKDLHLKLMGSVLGVYALSFFSCLIYFDVRKNALNEITNPLKTTLFKVSRAQVSCYDDLIRNHYFGSSSSFYCDANDSSLWHEGFMGGLITIIALLAVIIGWKIIDKYAEPFTEDAQIGEQKTQENEISESLVYLRISVGTDTYFGLQADSDFGFARTLIPELTGQLYQVSLVLSAKILHVVKLLFSFSARNHLLIPV